MGLRFEPAVRGKYAMTKYNSDPAYGLGSREKCDREELPNALESHCGTGLQSSSSMYSVSLRLANVNGGERLH